jgi:hypothetical protein
MQTAVHQLWSPPGHMRRTEVDILFFDGYSRDPSKWKSAWTQRSHPDVCWPEKWLPAGLEFDVRLLFVSYHGQPSVADVVDDLFKTLVIRYASVGSRDCRSGIPLDWIPVGLMDDWKPPGKSSASSRNDEMDDKFRSRVM